MPYSGPINALLLALLLVITTGISGDALAKRVALVVGNSAYPNNPLPSATARADRVAESMRKRGFDVTVVKDLDHYRFSQSLARFKSSSARADLSLVYLAGHGIQLRDRAYFMPVGSSLGGRSDLKRVIAVNDVLAAVAGARSSAVVLDTCTRSDFAADWQDDFRRAALCATDGLRLSPAARQMILLATAVPDASTDAVVADAMVAGMSSAKTVSALAEQIILGVDSATSGQLSVSRIGQVPDGSGSLDASDAERLSNSASIPAGAYGLSNVNQSRWLSLSASSQLVFRKSRQADAQDQWMIEETPQGQRVLRHLATGQYLAYSASEAKIRLTSALDSNTGHWNFENVSGGLPGEMHLRHHSSKTYLPGGFRGPDPELTLSAPPVGWLLVPVQVSAAEPQPRPQPEPRPADGSGTTDGSDGPSTAELPPAGFGSLTVLPTPADATVRILNIKPVYQPGMSLPLDQNYQIEVSKPGYRTETRWLRLDEAAESIGIVLAEQAAGGLVTPLSNADRPEARRRFEAVRDAVVRGDEAVLTSLVASGPELALFKALIKTYSLLSINVDQLRLDSSRQAFTGVLRIERMVLPNGDLVTPGDAYRDTTMVVYRDDAGRWSDVRWQ